MEALGDIFPWELAAEGDNCGLLVGSLDSDISGILCSVDLGRKVLAAALESGCDLLVCHHPQYFLRVFSQIDTTIPGGRIISDAIRGDLNVVACHTNADSAAGGTADLMSDHLGIKRRSPLVPCPGVHMAKIVVFVPPEAIDRVSESMSVAGAGIIGVYTHCSFRSEGTGTFIPGEEAKPYSGERGVLSMEEEIRLEMVAPSFAVPKIVRSMVAEHPYEEVAYDVYRTEGPIPWGIGRVGDIEEKRPWRYSKTWRNGAVPKVRLSSVTHV